MPQLGGVLLVILNDEIYAIDDPCDDTEQSWVVLDLHDAYILLTQRGKIPQQMRDKLRLSTHRECVAVLGECPHLYCELGRGLARLIVDVDLTRHCVALDC